MKYVKYNILFFSERIGKYDQGIVVLITASKIIKSFWYIY